MGRLGYRCYSFDFPCGSVRSRSDNNTLNMSILDEVNDVKTIVRQFRQQGHQHIVLIGESQGGLVSALAAAELKDMVSRLHIIPGAGHGFNPHELRQEMEQLELFLHTGIDFVKGADVGFLQARQRRGVTFSGPARTTAAAPLAPVEGGQQPLAVAQPKGGR